MPEQLQKMLDRIKEWWAKFNTKQRALLISITSVVVVALVILAVVVSQPKWVTLVSVETAREGAEVKALLEGDSIDYKVNSTGTVFKVKESDEANAVMLLGQNDIAGDDYSITNVTSGSFSQTSADKQKLYQDYLEKKFAAHIECLNNVEEARVDITLPNDDGTILSTEEQGTAAVILTLCGTMDSEQAYGLAKFIATELGNDDTSGITILDSDNNVLYSGADANSNMGVVSSQLSYQEKQEENIKEEIREALMESQIFSNVNVGINLSVIFDTTEVATHEYYAPDGYTNGMLSSASEYSSESYGGQAAAPGTTSNDDTTYVTEDGATTYSTINETQYQYQNNERITNTTNAGGSIDYDGSSASIVCTKYVTYDQALLEASGELDDITWDEFQAQHSEPVQVEVDEQFYNVVANATGFSTNNITILCYEQPLFIDKEKNSKSLNDILQIVLAVLVFIMLGYVVFRSTRKQKDSDVEPELSVDGLLESTQSNPEEPLEDIGYSEKSETRIMIERFIEENPDAAASLLRNWLNDDWN